MAGMRPGTSGEVDLARHVGFYAGQVRGRQGEAGVADNKTLVRNFFEKLNAKDFGAAAALMGDGVINHTKGLGGGDKFGLPQWLAMVEMLWAAFPDRAIEVHAIIGEGDRVAARITWTGTQKGQYLAVAPTGKPVEVNGMSIFRIQDGKIAEQWLEQDILALHQQLGAAPGHTANWPKS
jgi:steroid delta-isomerase-like uncharacterized protein